MTTYSDPGRFSTESSVFGKVEKTSTTIPFTFFESKSGTQNPLWRAQVASGKSATTAYVLTRTSRNHGYSSVEALYEEFGGSAPFKWWRNTYTGVGNILDAHLTSAGAFDANMKARVEVSARAGFLAKYRDTVAPFKGPVFLGELKQTLSMIRNPFGLLYRGVSEYATGAQRRARRGRFTRQDLYDMYLEYTYGWAPLVGDIESALKAYGRLVGEIKLHPFSFIANDEKLLSLATDRNAVAGTGGKLAYTYNVQKSVSVKSRVGGALRTDLASAPDHRGALELCGFEWNEFVPTFWELIPYSFLVDYATNISQIVTGWFTETSALGWSYQGTEEKAVTKVTGSPIPGTSSSFSKCISTSGVLAPSLEESIRYTRFVPSFGLAGNPLVFSVYPPSARQWFNATILGLKNLRSIPNR